MRGVVVAFRREVRVTNDTLCTALEEVATQAACQAIHAESQRLGQAFPPRGSQWDVEFADGLRRTYVVNYPYSQIACGGPAPGSSCQWTMSAAMLVP